MTFLIRKNMLIVSDIRKLFTEKYNSEEFVVDKTGCKVIEIISASFLADEDFIFGEPNQDYIDRELQWYLSMSLNVNDIPGNVPKIWKQVATPDGFINSNYGYLVFHWGNYSQFSNVVNELMKNPNSRRAVMIYTRPSMHQEYNKNGMSDFICTNTVQYLIRDDKLHSIVQMRSGDVVFGYRNDYAWQKYVLDKLSDELKIESGSIFWNVGSLHVYERHFKLIKDECK